MKTVTINLYPISELSKEAKDIAIENHKKFLIDTFNPSSFDDSCAMSKSDYRKSLSKSEVLDNIELNGYLFFINGELAHTTYFTGNHARAGEEILILKGVEFPII